MSKKRGKKGGKIPFPHVCTKNVCYCYVGDGYYGVDDAIDVIEDRYGGYPVRFVGDEKDLRSI